MSEEHGWKHGDDQRAVSLTAESMRAMAHPVRLRVVGLLRKYGPSTATRLAAELGINSGATSYHLRQLAAAGFVEEDEALGNARERWWRSAHRVTVWSVDDMAEEQLGEAAGYLRSVLAAHTLTAQRSLDAFETMPQDWRKAVNMSDLVLQLTPAEAQQLSGELSEVIRRYRWVGSEGPVPEGSEQVSVVVHVLPDVRDDTDEGGTT